VSKPVLITGAFGQAGKHCTEILLSRGRTVVATDLRTDALAATVEAGPGKAPRRAGDRICRPVEFQSSVTDD
jgi:NAD(P)-dependent dehydrogenase (short-subunit alcohol dehydrogenase family)